MFTRVTRDCSPSHIVEAIWVEGHGTVPMILELVRVMPLIVLLEIIYAILLK